jgi:hypothetical protein
MTVTILSRSSGLDSFDPKRNYEPLMHDLPHDDGS